MSIIHTEITLKNAVDQAIAATGMIKDYEVRQTTVKALVDTGSWTLVINEDIRKKLGLRIVGTDSGTLADGTTGSYDIAGPLEVVWKDRRPRNSQAQAASGLSRYLSRSANHTGDSTAIAVCGVQAGLHC